MTPAKTPMRFNPPPGWPAQPLGWIPAPDWTADPSWPPPPPGWEFWVEDGSLAPPAKQPMPVALKVAIGVAAVFLVIIVGALVVNASGGAPSQPAWCVNAPNCDQWSFNLGQNDGSNGGGAASGVRLGQSPVDACGLNYSGESMAPPLGYGDRVDAASYMQGCLAALGVHLIWMSANN